jgi:alpha-beta hydrolase superfamily lysophospholipase
VKYLYTAVTAFLLLTIGMSSPALAFGSQQADTKCTDVHIPASLFPGTPKSYSIYGKLCTPRKPATTLQILVHGMTYNRTYWNVPGFGPKYSYEYPMNKNGYATLAIDRVGSGQSSHPLGALVDADTGATALHDVVSFARSSKLPGGPYKKVVLVGHSYGTVVSMIEQTTYHDVDGLVLTGVMHLLNALQMTNIATHMVPASLNGRLWSQVGIDSTYLTTAPGAQRSLFFSPHSDPKMVRHWEGNKQTGTVTELATFAPRLVDGTTARINVPTLLAMGSADPFWCTGTHLENCRTDKVLYNSERPFYSREAQLQTYVLPGSGHDINLEGNSEEWYNRAEKWFEEFFPRSAY